MMRAWQIVSQGGIEALEINDVEPASPGPGQVKVAVKASAINYRDFSIISDPVARGINFPRIPNSDCAGEIIAVGANSGGFKQGDRVASCFFQNWTAGPCSPDAMATALGGPIDGVLAEHAILSANGIVKIPDHLSYEEASTLPCAGLTAWNALVETGRIKAGTTVLLLGTGGVSIFALQFATLMGARVILTSSSDEKLARAKELGAWQTINYTTTPDWDQAVLDMTNGVGADLTVEVGGAGTLEKSIASTRVAGTIALIGVLTSGQIDPVNIMRKSLKVQGIYVGSRRMFLDMTAAVNASGLKPVIDRTFSFDDAPQAYEAMAAAGHFGKIVISV